jgi:hypothetical protein
MVDQKQSLEDILDELHTVLERSPDVGEAGRTALERAAVDIRSALSAEGQSSDSESASLVDRLNDALERFEGSHPRPTQIVGRVADSLSDLGI